MRIYQKSTHFLDTEGLIVKKYESNITTHRHSHDFIEIVFVLSGSGAHEIGNTAYAIAPGCFYIVKSGETHDMRFSEFSAYYNIFLKDEYLAGIPLDPDDGGSLLSFICSLSQSESVVCFDAEKRLTMECIFRNLYLESDKHKHGNDALVKSYLRTLFLEYRECLCGLPRGQKHSPFVLPKVLDHIRMHYHENFRMEDIASQYGYNPVYFGRIFQKHYGKNLKNYISDLRVTKAGELLTTTDYSVAQICEYIGYTNKLQFYKKFKEKYGCTPKEYKTQATQNDNRLAIGTKTTGTSHSGLTLCQRWAGEAFSSSEYYAVTVTDDAMDGIGLRQNDTAILCANATCRDGSLVAIESKDGEIIIRQLYMITGQNGQYILHCCSREQQYPDIYLSEIRILGVVSHVVHRIS